MQMDVPRDRILDVDQADLVFDAVPHPYETENLAAIEDNWHAEVARNPALFDGKVLMFSKLSWRDGRIEGRCHAIRFATFLQWRRNGPETSVEHLFAQAMPVTSDGALIAIRMSARTASAGRVYFAAGAFDMSDVADGRIDIVSNMRREVLEETGIDLEHCRSDAGMHGHSSDRGTVLTQRYYLDEPAETIAARIRAFIAADPDPEISDAVIIRGAEDFPEGLMPHMVPLIKWHFGG